MPATHPPLPPEFASLGPPLALLGVASIAPLFHAYREQTAGETTVEGFVDWLVANAHLATADAARLTPGATSLVTWGGGTPDAGEPASATSSRPLEERFEILGVVGRGGMGEIQLALDRDLARSVAIKVLSADVPMASSTARRFVNEARVTAQLEHPNIVPVHAMERTEQGRPAYTMKLIRGLTLREFVDRCAEQVRSRAPLDASQQLPSRLEHFVKVCEAMAYAHGRGVIHRDLKPENLMVGPWGEVYVMDWGIAKLIGAEDRTAADASADTSDVVGLPTETQMGHVLGTPAYMSPEQAGADRELGPKSDQFALGLILFELATLKRAYPGTDTVSVLGRATMVDMEPATDLGDNPLPTDLRAIIARATCRAPHERYPDVGALGDDVRRFLHFEEVAARPDNSLRKAIRWLQRHPGTAATGVSGLLLAASFMVAASLAIALTTQLRSADRAEHLAAVASAVARRSHAIDRELLSYQALLTDVSEATVVLWDEGIEYEGPIYDRAALDEGRGPPDYGMSPRYKQAVTVTHPSHILAPGIELDAVESDIRRLLPLNETFRRAFLRSHAEEAVEWDAERATRLLSEQWVPPAWVYLGLDNGVLINFPGLASLSTDYDTRARPWYTATQGTRGPRFGSPYYDDSGYAILLPCNMALYDHQGTFFGVAGLDVTLDTVIEILPPPDLDGVHTAYLVDQQGRIVVSTEMAGLEGQSGLHGNLALEREPFPEERIASRMRRGELSGFIDLGDELIAFDRTEALGWYYAVRMAD